MQQILNRGPVEEKHVRADRWLNCHLCLIPCLWKSCWNAVGKSEREMDRHLNLVLISLLYYYQFIPNTKPAHRRFGSSSSPAATFSEEINVAKVSELNLLPACWQKVSCERTCEIILRRDKMTFAPLSPASLPFHQCVNVWTKFIQPSGVNFLTSVSRMIMWHIQPASKTKTDIQYFYFYIIFLETPLKFHGTHQSITGAYGCTSFNRVFIPHFS